MPLRSGSGSEDQVSTAHKSVMCPVRYAIVPSGANSTRVFGQTPCLSLGYGAMSLKVATRGQHKLVADSGNKVAAQGLHCPRRRYVYDIGAVTTDHDLTVLFR